MLKAFPLLSVIMPAYNTEQFIEFSIKSMINQTYTNWELIIIDDGSSDNTANIVQHWLKRDKRIRFIQQENSGKPSIARNKGINTAKGKYISFLDADDTYNKDRLLLAVEALETNRDIALCFCDYSMTDDLGTCIDLSYLKTRDFTTRSKEFLTPKSQGFLCNKHFIRFMATEMTVIHTNTITFRKSLLANEPFAFNENMTIGEDLDLWFRLINNQYSFYSPQVLADYKVHPNSITKNYEALLLGKAETHQVNFHRVKHLLTTDESVKLSSSLSSYYSDLGYYYRTDNQQFKAVKYYWQSFLNQKNIKNLINILKVFVLYPVRQKHK